jgi:hypothetical protein
MRAAGPGGPGRSFSFFTGPVRMLEPAASRRRFLALCAAVLAALRPRALAALDARGPRAARRAIVHPDPRPGIDATRVLGPELLRDHPEAGPAFDAVRRIPQIADGLGCGCECAERDGLRSLLSCFEEEGMALSCAICQGEARLAYRLHLDGRTLAEIRRAVDARYG